MQHRTFQAAEISRWLKILGAHGLMVHTRAPRGDGNTDGNTDGNPTRCCRFSRRLRG